MAVVHASHHGEAAVLAAAHQRHHLHRLALSRSRIKLKLESAPVPRSPAAEMGSGLAAPLYSVRLLRHGEAAAQSRRHARCTLARSREAESASSAAQAQLLG